MLGRDDFVKKCIGNIQLAINTSGQDLGSTKWSHNLNRSLMIVWSPDKAKEKERPVLEQLQRSCSMDFFIACCCVFNRFFIENHLGAAFEQITRYDTRERIDWTYKVKHAVVGLDIQADAYKSWVNDFQNRCNAELTNIDSTWSMDNILAKLAQCGIDGSIPSLESLEDVNKLIWEPYSLLPQRLGSDKCWKNRPPSHDEMIEETMAQLSYSHAHGKQKVRLQSEINGNAAPPPEAIRYLLAAGTSCAKLWDIPGDNEGTFILQCPLQSRGTSVARRASNWVSKGAIFNFHMDAGMEGLSAVVKPCIKVWFLAPPTPTNLETLKRSPELRPEDYEGCVMTVTTHEEVIYLPAGCIHGTFTFEAGFLTGITFYDEHSIRGVFASFLYALDVDNGGHLETDLRLFCKVFDQALRSESTSKHTARELWEKHGEELKLRTTNQTEADKSRWPKGVHPWGAISAVLKRNGVAEPKSAQGEQRTGQSTTKESSSTMNSKRRVAKRDAGKEDNPAGKQKKKVKA